MVTRLMPGHLKFRTAMFIILGTFITQKYCDNMSQLWDQAMSQLKSFKNKVLELSSDFRLSRHHMTTGNMFYTF